MIRYAVADIGTNSARLMIAHTKNGTVITDYKTLRYVRVGEGMGEGRIAFAAMQRAAQALNEFTDISNQYGAKQLICFATSAVRDAKNQNAFLSHIKNECGIQIDIVSGEKEAMLGFAGAVSGFGGVFDIGGGSTEVMVGSLEDIRFKHSYNIGTVRCHTLFPGGDAADPHAFEQAHVLAAETYNQAPSQQGFVYTSIGGTATALAAIDLGLSVYDGARVQGHVMRIKTAESLCSMLKSKTKQQRKELMGLDDRKADVIVFGAILFVEFLKAVNTQSVIISDSDNLEGYLKLRLGLV